MATVKRLRVAVAADGAVSVETVGFSGPECLDQIALLEDLLDATTVQSRFTEDYYRNNNLNEETQSVEFRQR